MILKQRLDGFVSLDCGEQLGSVVTRPLRAEGNRLVLNIASSEGIARVAILDRSGRPYNGFSLDDCIPLSCDSVRAHVRWQRNADLAPLAGKVLRLKFELSETKLFAMQFAGR